MSDEESERNEVKQGSEESKEEKEEEVDNESEKEEYNIVNDDKNVKVDYEENAEKKKELEEEIEEKNKSQKSHIVNLNFIEIDKTNRDDVIKLLMTGTIKKPLQENYINEEYKDKDKSQIEHQSTIKKPHSFEKTNIKTLNPYKNAVSTISKYLKGQSQNENIKFCKSDKYHIYVDEGSEFTDDFDKAKRKFLSKLSQEEKDGEVMKLLFSGRRLASPKLKYENTKEGISEKVSKALSKKQVTINKIVNQCNEKYNQEHTFSPTINPSNQPRRDFNKFIEDQNSHLKRVEEKIKREKEKEKEDEMKEKKKKPQINKNSDKIFASIEKKNEPVYLRLFNAEYKTAKGNLLKEKEKEREKKEKEEAEKKNNKNKEKKLFKKIIPKEEIDPTVEKAKKKKNEKVDYWKNIQKHLMLCKDIPNNKLILQNFNVKFNNIKDEYLNKRIKIEKDNNNEPPLIQEELHEEEQEKNNNSPEIEEEKKEINYNNSKKENNKQLNKLSLQQLHDIIHLMGMCSKPSLESAIPINEGAFHLKEKQLVSDIFEHLKDKDNMVNINDLKKFLICIIGLHMYSLYIEYKLAHPEKENDQIAQGDDISQEDKIDSCIIAQDKENQEKIAQDNQRNNKYVSYDKEGNAIIPIDKAKRIKKNFQLFSITYMSNRSITHKTQKNDNMLKEFFKPHIDDKSKKMSRKFREKLMTESANVDNNNDRHLQYIERIILKRKQKIAENQRLKEELDKKELEECTFKPQIKNVSTITKARGANRFNELFKKGSEKQKIRKNRTKDDFEIERHGKECTFKPNLTKNETPIPETHFNNDIYNEKSYRLLYERLLNGRVERQIKDAVNDRFGLSSYLKDCVKKRKDLEFIQQTINSDGNLLQSSNDVTTGNINEEGNDQNTPNKSNSDIKDDNNERENYQNSDEGGDQEIERKDGIPLLIIDVNIRQGVKKKIYVYEGDTSEGLAEKFSREHNLEPQTKEKLQNLIHTHMLRLLTRIDEENPSISEKSTTHMQKSQ